MSTLKESTIVKISVIKEPTEKGYQTLQCSVSNGFAVNSKPTYVLSTPEAIKANKLEVGMDISDMCRKMGMEQVETESTDTDTGEVIKFNWLTI